CARRPGVIPSSMKVRALRKMSKRVFMARLLGKTGSSDDCPSPDPDFAPAGFRWKRPSISHGFRQVMGPPVVASNTLLTYPLCISEISKMDLKRLRTFVAVADLGTVSKAGLRLRISQSALSRQISDLEHECGFKLFDRIGRRLFLTTRGEQLLADCRGILGQIGSLGERIELLKRGDSGVLKLAAPPQTIESVLSRFLPRYAKNFPNVRVKLTEALGMDQVPLL